MRREVPTVGKTSLNSRGGTASFGEPEGLSWPTVSCKQDRVTGSNWSKTAEQVKEIEGSLVDGEMRALAEETSSIKKCGKFSQTAGEASKQTVWALRTEPMVLNKV